MQNIYLVIVDPQNDFTEGGSLPVNGATGDMHAIASIIKQSSSSFTGIIVTLDSHSFVHVAQMSAWYYIDSGESPTPINGQFPQVIRTCTYSSDKKYTNTYMVNNIEVVCRIKNLYCDEGNKSIMGENYEYAYNNKNGLFPDSVKLDKPLILWPDHCIEGTPGHDVHPVLMDALKLHNNIVTYIYKGRNPRLEEFSAVVPDYERCDPARRNEFDKSSRLIVKLKNASKVYVVGEALDFCVNSTASDIERCTTVPVIILNDLSSSVFSNTLKIPENTRLKLEACKKHNFVLTSTIQIDPDTAKTLTKMTQYFLTPHKEDFIRVGSNGEMDNPKICNETVHETIFKKISCGDKSVHPISRDWVNAHLRLNQVSYINYRIDVPPIENPFATTNMVKGRGCLPFFGPNWVKIYHHEMKWYLDVNQIHSNENFEENEYCGYLPHPYNTCHSWIEAIVIRTKFEKNCTCPLLTNVHIVNFLNKVTKEI